MSLKVLTKTFSSQKVLRRWKKRSQSLRSALTLGPFSSLLLLKGNILNAEMTPSDLHFLERNHD